MPHALCLWFFHECRPLAGWTVLLTHHPLPYNKNNRPSRRARCWPSPSRPFWRRPTRTRSSRWTCSRPRHWSTVSTGRTPARYVSVACNACIVIAIPAVGGLCLRVGVIDRFVFVDQRPPPHPTPPTTPQQELPTLISRSKAEVESELGDAPPMIYTLPDSLQARLARACVAHRQAAAGLKKKVICRGWRVGVIVCVEGVDLIRPSSSNSCHHSNTSPPHTLSLIPLF